jgi:hypothetical protein
MEARWSHVAAFFFTFYLVEAAIYGARPFIQLFVSTPFLWLFPIVTGVVILLLRQLKRRAM